MKTYKGMNSDMTCRGFQYEPDGEYEMDGEIKVCKRGFHGCEMPLDVLQYYAPGRNSRYFEVEQDGEIVKDDYNTKIASRKIKIGTEIGLAGLIEAQVEWVKARATTEHTDSKQATAGDYGVSSADNFGVSSAGWHGVSSAGWWSVSSADAFGVSSAGKYGVSSAGSGGVSSAGSGGVSSVGHGGVSSVGDYGISLVGNYSVSSAGNEGRSSAGDYGVSTSRGSASVGKNGIACVRGNGVRVRGGIGALLVIGVEKNNSKDDGYSLAEWKAVIVDGKKIKANIWYTLQDGELIEVK